MDTNTEKKNSKAREHYSHDKADAWKDKLRQEAEARQFEHDKLTLAQKLAKDQARVKEGKGNCTRKIARLTKKVVELLAESLSAVCRLLDSVN